MTLPTSKSDVDIYTQRPGDDIFAKIKHHFPYIAERSTQLKDSLVKAIIDDMAMDYAMSDALDEIGKILEYQAQNDGIEKPRFNGLSIMKDTERVSKLNFILTICKVLDLPEETVEAVRNAEIDRLWGTDVATKGTKEGNTLQLPKEIAGLLRDITRVMSKRSTNGTGKTADGTVQSAGRSGNSNPKAHSGSQGKRAKETD